MARHSGPEVLSVRRLISLLLLVATPVTAFAQAEEFAISAASPPAPPEWTSLVVAEDMISPLTLEARSLSGAPKPQSPKKGKKGKKEKPAKPERDQGVVLGPERARTLLRSLVVPGWGQATMGKRKSGAWFAAAELGVWTAFTSFRVQESMRRQTYQRTARLDAGIELRERDEEFQRIVGSFISSDEYNLLVVARDAANLYLTDPYNPDMESYRRYIAEHSLGGSNAWSWSSLEAFRKYSSQRKDAHRAGLRANTAIAVAVANRIASAIHATRAAGRAPAAEPPRAWNFEIVPDPRDAEAVRAGVRVTF